MRQFLLLTVLFASISVSSFAEDETYVGKIGEDLTNTEAALKAKLDEAVNIIGSFVKCGNMGELSQAAGCAKIPETDPNVANYAKNGVGSEYAVPDCGEDYFLVPTGKYTMNCAPVSDFQYGVLVDPFTGQACAGDAPKNKYYCRCGKWVNKQTYLSTSEC